MSKSTSKEEFIAHELKSNFGDVISELKVTGPRRVYVTVPPESLRDILLFLKNMFNARHIVTITGIDMMKSFELIYHIAVPGEHIRSILVNVKTHIPRDNPTMPSVVDILPGATLYEREVHDLLGIVFEGHPNLERLILPDDWPEDEFPLRKDWKPKEV
ncbi:MAG: NADH-quinone oxidoreductase subunit C [archaeon GB-1867-035]|nr:NADH-quinone oxidoreductase subunit C [Candidatus Culexmicrobium profundum]